MKNIIIAGSSRSGKSTLAKRIARNLQMSYLPMDSIVSTLETLYPQVGIAHRDDNRDMSGQIARFLQEWIQHLAYEEIPYVLDLYQVYPADLKTLDPTGSHAVAYLGYASLSPEEKLPDIRQYARPIDWTNQVDDQEMTRILDLFIQEGRRMRQQCVEENIAYFDTGAKFHETLDAAYDYIVQARSS